ncbi:hypothetical protein GALL_144900 [mine drainage metagenome]|uniref:Uncharacterized protein n=1 Tax=mine drainage metagenome TaxID=410659 RepID=A0A1J5S5M3_9ZZZZ
MYLFVVISYIAFLLILVFLLTRKDDKIIELQERVSFLEQKVNKKLVSRLLFVELKSVNSVLDTLNNCFYLKDKDGDYIVDSEYRLSDVEDDWWEKLSEDDLEIVNRIKG